MNKNIWRIIGAAGALASVIIYINEPSFPTPDKLFVFGIFVAMIFSQSVELIKRFSPFIGLILIYESFRGIADHLNNHVNFMFMIRADEWMFGTLPTVTLQNWLWNGHVRWYDFLFYLAYMMHFLFPLVLAVYIWKKRPKLYWVFVTTYVLLMIAGFITYLLFPAAPPWMASKAHLIQPIERVSSDVWFALGIHDFPSLYNEIAPNPVAAVPSLHAAFSVIFAIFTTTLFKTKFKYLSWGYPVLIIFGTVYMGEHYLIDALLGILYAAIAYFISPRILQYLKNLWQKNKKPKLGESTSA